MMNRIVVVLKCCVFFLLASCSKDESTNTTGSLQSFNVTVVERTSISAVIQWDSCVNTINNEIPKYRVILRDRVVHNNLSKLTDSLISLNKDTVYNGKVVAYISTGDTTFASFTISTYQGVVYAATYSTSNSSVSRLGCFNSYPILGVQPQPSIWRNNTPQVSSLTFSNDTLFAIMGNRLTAVNAKTGSTLWQTTTNLNYSTMATYNNGRLYACTNLGLTAFNSSSGQVVWTYSSPAPYGPFNSTPVVDGGKVFIAITNYLQGQIHGVDVVTGTKIWSATYNNTICQKPLAANGVVVIISGTNASATAYNSNTGAILWTKTGLGASIGLDQFNPILSDGNVLVHTSASLHAFNLQTGSQVWEFGSANGNLLLECVTGNGMIYFSTQIYGTNNSDVFCINAKTGKLIWRTPSPSTLNYSDLIFAKDRLYCLRSYVSYFNALYTFNALTGEEDIFFVGINPITTNQFEIINALIIKRDDVVCYPSYHGNYK
jgi:outer membrane protein assembly factor BamB